MKYCSFVTIKIFARTELSQRAQYETIRFVTIKIFARTEPLRTFVPNPLCFVAIRILIERI